MPKARSRPTALAALLLVAAAALVAIAPPAQAGLILDLSLSPTAQVSTHNGTTAGTYTIYLLAEIYYTAATPNNYINNLSMNLVSSTASTWASGTGITNVQLYDGTNSTTNYFDAYHGSAPSSNGSATASPGLSSDNVGDWGTALKSTNIFANAGTPTAPPYNGPANGATPMPVGVNGFAVTGFDGSPGWAWVLGTATLTVGTLPSGAGSVAYQAQIPQGTFPTSTTKASWFQNNAIIASTTPRNGLGTTWAVASTGASVMEGVGNGITFNFTGGTNPVPVITLDTTIPGHGYTSSLDIFVGAPATVMTLPLSNTGAVGSTLNWTATLASILPPPTTGFSATGVPGATSGALAQGAGFVNAQYNVTDTAAADVGTHTLTWTVSSTPVVASNDPQAASATLNVYAHGVLSFTAGGGAATITPQTLTFNALKGPGGSAVSQSFNIANWGPVLNAAWIGLVDVNAPSGFAAPYTTNFTSKASDLAYSTTANSYNVLLSTTNAGTFGTAGSPQTITITGGDASSLSGRPGYLSILSNPQSLTLNLVGTVGLATPLSDNVAGDFGTALTAPVAASGGSYLGLESTTVAASGSAGAAHIATTATILAGTNSSTAKTVSEAWRTRLTNVNERLVLISDVLNLTGMSTDPFVLQMTGDPATLATFGRGTAAQMQARGALYLGSLDTGAWNPAVASDTGNNATAGERNFLGSFTSFQDLYGTDLTQYIGAYGVDLGSGITAWAVVNHNGQFAVTPEPATMAFLMLGGLSMAAAGLLRRRRANP